MQPTLLLLAAGMGSRYGGLKQLDAMGPSGQTMVDYAVEDACRAGFGKVVFVIRKDFEEAFRSQVGEKHRNTIEVRYAFQDLHDLPDDHRLPEGRTKPWGTAHAVRAARDCIAEPFAVINADDFYGREAYAQMATFLKQMGADSPELSSEATGGAGLSPELSSEATSELDLSPELSSEATGGADGAPEQKSGVRGRLAAGMVGYILRNTLSPHGTVNRGICAIQDGNLQSVEEYTAIGHDADGVLRGDNLEGKRIPVSEGAVVSMNFWGFTPAIFAPLEAHFEAFLCDRGTEEKSEYYLPSLVDSLIRKGAIECPVLETESPWFGVTYPEDKARVVESMRQLSDAGLY